MNNVAENKDRRGQIEPRPNITYIIRPENETDYEQKEHYQEVINELDLILAELKNA